MSRGEHTHLCPEAGVSCKIRRWASNCAPYGLDRPWIAVFGMSMVNFGIVCTPWCFLNQGFRILMESPKQNKTKETCKFLQYGMQELCNVLHDLYDPLIWRDSSTLNGGRKCAFSCIMTMLLNVLLVFSPKMRILPHSVCAFHVRVFYHSHGGMSETQKPQGVLKVLLLSLSQASSLSLLCDIMKAVVVLLRRHHSFYDTL